MPSSLIDVIRQHAPTPTGTIPPVKADRYELLAALSAVPDPHGRRCIAGSTDVLNSCQVRDQIGWVSSVNAAATRSMRGASTASS
jgi:hypothetical protein